MDLVLVPIGVVRSPFSTPLDAPRQGEFARAESRLEIHPDFAEGLTGIRPGDPLLVVWWAHLADRTLLSRPGADRGVFAGRAPHRPNPIALSEVQVTAVEGTTLLVRGLDAVDGSPVLDLKSVHAEWEGWTGLPDVEALARDDDPGR